MIDQNELPNIKIKRIKEQYFSINEPILTDISRLIKIEIGQNLGFAIEANLVSLTIRIYYHYPEDANNILAEISVQNIYEISDLYRFQISETEIKLPKQTITSILSVSISHTRSLLAKNLLGTVLHESLPALVNPEDIAMHFFPNMFETSEKIEKRVSTN